MKTIYLPNLIKTMLVVMLTFNLAHCKSDKEEPQKIPIPTDSNPENTVIFQGTVSIFKKVVDALFPSAHAAEIVTPGMSITYGCNSSCDPETQRCAKLYIVTNSSENLICASQVNSAKEFSLEVKEEAIPDNSVIKIDVDESSSDSTTTKGFRSIVTIFKRSSHAQEDNGVGSNGIARKSRKYENIDISASETMQTPLLINYIKNNYASRSSLDILTYKSTFPASEIMDNLGKTGALLQLNMNPTSGTSASDTVTFVNEYGSTLIRNAESASQLATIVTQTKEVEDNNSNNVTATTVASNDDLSISLRKFNKIIDIAKTESIVNQQSSCSSCSSATNMAEQTEVKARYTDDQVNTYVNTFSSSLPQSSSSSATPKATLGQSCSLDPGCFPSTTTCTGGTCKILDNNSCSSNSDCESGICKTYLTGPGKVCFSNGRFDISKYDKAVFQ